MDFINKMFRTLCALTQDLRRMKQTIRRFPKLFPEEKLDTIVNEVEKLERHRSGVLIELRQLLESFVGKAICTTVLDESQLKDICFVIASGVNHKELMGFSEKLKQGEMLINDFESMLHGVKEMFKHVVARTETLEEPATGEHDVHSVSLTLYGFSPYIADQIKSSPGKKKFADDLELFSFTDKYCSDDEDDGDQINKSWVMITKLRKKMRKPRKKLYKIEDDIP